MSSRESRLVFHSSTLTNEHHTIGNSGEEKSLNFPITLRGNLGERVRNSFSKVCPVRGNSHRQHRVFI